jgi:putative GTP pyrophosphokinase
MKPTTDAILAQFDEGESLYSDFAQKLFTLISAILGEQGVKVHSVTFRPKRRESLLKKLSKPGMSYVRLSDITDIAGIRITTFFEDDVDRVATLIESEFAIDWTNSVDKRAALDPDRFGYLSLHHVLELSEERASLIEYRRFKGLKAEVQTRSILQHAWAEIEHDLGYKTAAGVPNEIRRRFSRLAGLLELADQEFGTIRDSLATYENTVAEKIETAPQLVEINKASLESFISNNELIKRLDLAIANIGQGTLVPEKDPEYIEYQVTRLIKLDFESIGELETTLEESQPIILAFASRWLESQKGLPFPEGVTLHYLGYVAIAQSNDRARIAGYLEDLNIGDEMERDGMVERILDVYQFVA